MKKLLLGTMFIIALISAPFGHAMNPLASSAIPWSSTAKVSAGILAGMTGYTLGKYLYAKYTAYVNNKIINETVDALYLSITLNNTIEKLPQSEREQAYRKKAQCINARKRVIVQLTDIEKQASLSKQHSASLHKLLYRTSKIFNLVDSIRTQNPYEQDYIVASRLDKIVENSLIKSIILNLKPENECTQAELTKKQELAHRRSIIEHKLKNKIVENALDNYGIYIRIAKLILF